MVTTRRANGITKPSAAIRNATDSPALSTPSAEDTPTTASPIPAPTHSPYLPTSTERLLLLAYPLTLFFGSLFSHVSPTLRAPFNASTYSTQHQSFQPASDAPSYFAQKRNVFNVYFVKIGWFWCTAAFFTFLVLVTRGRGAQRRKSGRGSEQDIATTRAVQWDQQAGLLWRQERDATDAKIRRAYQATFRYLIATAFWTVTTQWFFGPGLVDRGFSLSGGACRIAEHEVESADSEMKMRAAQAFSHAACNIAGGRWIGGYDISGHTFILILGSGMLWMEILPFLFPDLKGLGVGRVVREWSGKDERVANELGAAGAELYRTPSLDVDRHKEPVKWTLKRAALSGTVIVAGLSWWMLLMTAAFFHEWVEKLTACILAFTGIYVIYFLPRGLPTMRSIVGMPGV